MVAAQLSGAPSRADRPVEAHPLPTEVWSIRELNDLFETQGGTVAMQPGGDDSSIVVTLTLPDGRQTQTDWEPAFHAFGFGLPVVRAFYFDAAVAA